MHQPKPPAIDDPGTAEFYFGPHSERFLRIFLRLVLAAMIALGLHTLWVQPAGSQWRAWDNLAIALLVGVTLRLIARQRMRAAVMALLWGIWAVLMTGALLHPGLGYSGLYACPLLLMLAGWMLGKRQAWAMAALSILAFTMLAVMEPAVAKAGRESAWVGAVSLSAVVALGAAIAAGLADSKKRQYLQVLDLSRNLELRVAKRTQHLEEALDQLRRTQDELVEAKKLSSLGSLVAGVSHELNTPIGNAMIAASALHDRLQALAKAAAGRSMSRSAMNEFIQVGQELSELVLHSTRRASELIASFKQVAIDGTSEARRSFDLGVALGDLVRAFGPMLKTQAWRIELDVPAGLLCDSYPGPLEQVVTNLIQNAERHAFAGRDGGLLRISAEAQGERVCISVSDDGAGMSAETAARVFEPFFTTQFGKGGSGLGLSICRNIVTGLLGGSLTVSSQLGQGSRFRIEMPRRAPLRP